MSAAVTAAGALAAGVAAAAGGGPSGRAPCIGAKPPATWRHVIWIVFENKTYGQILGSPQAPYVSQLAARCGIATNFYAVAHPSLPNYIAMTSGSTQGIAGDAGPARYPVSAPSVFSQLGANWRALEESMPSNCALDDAGTYAVRHNPAAYYTGLRPRCGLQDVPLGATPDLSARFTFIAPNLCNDMHDCSIATGDSWLAALMPKILDSSQYLSGSTAVFITWDEDDYHANQHIPAIVVAPATRPGTRAATRFDHYSLLRTTEELLGLKTFLGNAAAAPSMRRAFGLAADVRPGA
jgi:hypothetical protein